jgi:hypothetical protein
MESTRQVRNGNRRIDEKLRESSDNEPAGASSESAGSFSSERAEAATRCRV